MPSSYAKLRITYRYSGPGNYLSPFVNQAADPIVAGSQKGNRPK
jgi:hypothetical protein